MKRKLAGPIEVLREWDRRWSVSSVATSLAVYWVEALGRPWAATHQQHIDALVIASPERMRHPST